MYFLVGCADHGDCPSAAEITPDSQFLIHTSDRRIGRPSLSCIPRLSPLPPSPPPLIDIGRQDIVLPWHCQFSRLASPFLGAVI